MKTFTTITPFLLVSAACGGEMTTGLGADTGTPSTDGGPPPRQPLDWPEEPPGFTWVQLIPRHPIDPDDLSEKPVYDVVAGGHDRSIRAPLDHDRPPEDNRSWRLVDFFCGVEAGENEIRCGEPGLVNVSREGWFPGVYPVSPGAEIKHISVSDRLICLLDEFGDVTCTGEAMDDTPPGPFRLVRAGVSNACALDTRGRVHCWGRDGTHVFNRHRFVGLAFPGSLYRETACFLDDAARVHCVEFVEGREPEETSLLPSPMNGWHSIFGPWQVEQCGIQASDGEIVCMNESSGRRVPTILTHAPRARGVHFNFDHGCLIDADGHLFCYREDGSRVMNVPETLPPR